MYKFCDISKAPESILGLSTEYAGINLDYKYLHSFKTLNVTGRGILAPEVRYTEKVGAPGVWVDATDLPARRIEVEAMIQGDDLRPIFNALAKIMAQKEPQRLVFSDEGEYYFNAILESIDAPKEDRNNLLITLYFLCPDPFKYKDEEKISGAGLISFNKKTVWPAKLNRLLVSGVPDGDLRVQFESAGKRLIFNGFKASEASGQRGVMFDFESGTINAKGINLMHKLSLESDFELLELIPGERMIATPRSVSLTAWYQERLL